MTLITAINENGNIHMCGDSIGSNGYTKLQMKHPKVFKNGELLIGYTTSFRMGQLLEHTLTPPKHYDDETNTYYIINKLVPAIIKLFKEHQFLTKRDEEIIGGNFIIGYKGELWEIQNDFAALQTNQNYTAVGAGEAYAMGALATTTHMKPVERLQAVHKAVEEHCAMVAGPHHTQSIINATVNNVQITQLSEEQDNQ